MHKLLILAFWEWLRPKIKWLVVALAAVCTLGFSLRRRAPYQPKPLSAKDADALAEALRPGMARRVEERRKEAEQHKAFAEQRLAQAKMEAERIKSMPAADVLRESQSYARKTRARRGKGLLLALAFFWLPLVARAQEALPYQLRDPSTGEHGWYIPDDVWRSALADALALEELEAALARFRQALAARELETDELRRSVEFERSVGALAAAKLETANESLARAGRWWRSPRFLVPLGVVLGAAVTTIPLVVSR